MKNLHKAMLSIASVAITLSSGAFAMDPDGDDVSCSASTLRAGTSAAAASAPSRGYEMLPFEGEETYEQWLERRLDAFASSRLFSALPAEKRDPLLNLSLRDHIARWQQTPKLFYNPLMEADPRMKVVRAFNAELAILWFEKDTIAKLVQKQNMEEKIDSLEMLIGATEENYASRSAFVKRMGQGIVSEIVEDLMKAQAHEIQQKEKHFSQLRARWSAEYAEKGANSGRVWGLPPVLEEYGTHNTRIDLKVLGIAEHFCTAQIHQNKAWREDLRMHELFKREGLLHDIELGKREIDELYKRGMAEMIREGLRMGQLKIEDLPDVFKREIDKLGKRLSLLRFELSKLKTPIRLYNILAQEQFLEEREAKEKEQRAQIAECVQKLCTQFSLMTQSQK